MPYRCISQVPVNQVQQQHATLGPGPVTASTVSLTPEAVAALRCWSDSKAQSRVINGAHWINYYNALCLHFARPSL